MQILHGMIFKSQSFAVIVLLINCLENNSKKFTKIIMAS